MYCKADGCTGSQIVIAIVLLLNGFRICWSALAMSDQMLDSMLGDIVHSSALAYRVLPKG